MTCVTLERTIDHGWQEAGYTENLEWAAPSAVLWRAFGLCACVVGREPLEARPALWRGRVEAWLGWWWAVCTRNQEAVQGGKKLESDLAMHVCGVHVPCAPVPESWGLCFFEIISWPTLGIKKQSPCLHGYPSYETAPREAVSPALVGPCSPSCTRAGLSVFPTHQGALPGLIWEQVHISRLDEFPPSCTVDGQG